MHIDRCTRTELYRALFQAGADVETIEKSDPSKKRLQKIYRDMLARQLCQWKFGEFTN